MTIFDTLSQLESYVNAVPYLKHVITIMDRSLPYKDGAGEYKCKEESKVTYTVESLQTSPSGREFEVPEGGNAVIVTLNGDQMVSHYSPDSVWKMPEGRFLLLPPGHYKKGLTDTNDMTVDMVTFHLPIE